MVGLEVRRNGQFGGTDTTQHRGFVESIARPGNRFVIGDGLVTPKTGIIVLTAVEFERDDVSVGSIVCTPSVVVDSQPADGVSRHGS